MPANQKSNGRKLTWRIVIASSVGLILVALAGLSLYRILQVPENTSDAVAKVWVLDKYTTGGKFAWTENLIASSSGSDLAAPLQCPAESTGVFVFISRPGHERDGLAAWNAYTETSFMPGGTQVLEPNLKPSGMISGMPGARTIHAQGGNFSLGVACTTQSAAKVNWVAYRQISFDPNGDITLADEPKLQDR